MIKTANNELMLKIIESADAHVLYKLVQENREHLTQNGDYSELVEMSLKQTQLNIQQCHQNTELFGMYFQGGLVGTVSLTSYDEYVYGLGYWLAKGFSGKGLMHESLKAMMDYAVTQHRAKAFWAGITHSNQASVKLVTKLGFKLARTQSTHDSFKREVCGS